MLVSHSVYDIVYIVNIVFFKDCKLFVKLYRLKPTADHVPITLHSSFVGQLAEKFLFYCKGLLIVIINQIHQLISSISFEVKKLYIKMGLP